MIIFMFATCDISSCTIFYKEFRSGIYDQVVKTNMSRQRNNLNNLRKTIDDLMRNLVQYIETRNVIL